MDQTDVVRLASETDGELASRIEFLLEIDKLKSVLRRSLLTDGSRLENTAEHSWHLAMFATILAPYAEPDVDPVRAMEILLVHDLVEIDAGDTYIYDEAGRETKEAKERAAAERLFNLLPPAQAAHVAELWDEYEERQTPTARFAYAIDRLQPLMLNAASGGASWLKHGIHHSQAATVNAPIGAGSQTLWEFADRLLATAADEGVLADDRS